MAQVQIVYAATAEGLVQLADPGATGRWRIVDRALEGTDVVAVCASPVDPLHAAAATADAIYETTDGGAGWERVYEGAVAGLAATNDAIYAGTPGGAILRHGATESWSQVHQGSAALVRLGSLHADRLAAIYADGTIEVLTGAIWRPLDAHTSDPTNIVSSVTEPDTYYVVDATGLTTATGHVAVGEGPTGALVLLPGKTEVLLCGTSGALQRSDDGGANFAPVEPTDVRVLVSPPRYQDQVYAGTGAGDLWFSRDRGRTWAVLRGGLAAVRDLSFARVI